MILMTIRSPRIFSQAHKPPVFPTTVIITLSNHLNSFCLLDVLSLARNQLVTLAPQGIAASILFISMASSIYLAFSFHLLLLLLKRASLDLVEFDSSWLCILKKLQKAYCL